MSGKKRTGNSLMRILFMGTPEFAAESLRRIYADRHEVCGVFTQPDKPRDRGMKLGQNPVKETALLHGTPIYQPMTLRDGTAAEEIRSLEPEIIVVVAYGKIIPKEILQIPPKECINVHASLLPKYRGSAPIQWSILNGDKVTGITTIYLDEKMDSGDIILKRKVQIGEYETSGELFERLKYVGAEVLSETLRAIEDGTAVRTRQNEAEAVYVRMLTKDDSPIDWSLSSEQIINKIRGLKPWPMATAVFGGKLLKMHAAVKTGRTSDRPAGNIVSTGREGIEVVCGDGKTILITELQEAGKKQMRASDYLLGHKL